MGQQLLTRAPDDIYYLYLRNLGLGSFYIIMYKYKYCTIFDLKVKYQRSKDLDLLQSY